MVDSSLPCLIWAPTGNLEGRIPGALARQGLKPVLEWESLAPSSVAAGLALLACRPLPLGAFEQASSAPAAGLGSPLLRLEPCGGCGPLPSGAAGGERGGRGAARASLPPRGGSCIAPLGAWARRCCGCARLSLVPHVSCVGCPQHWDIQRGAIHLLPEPGSWVQLARVVAAREGEAPQKKPYRQGVSY